MISRKSQALQKKYDRIFNFFFCKSINNIIENQTIHPSTIDYKDSAIFSENNEYLKRLYFEKNSFGRNEIAERIQMLAEFYDSSFFIQAQFPTMILSNTKDIFLKRIRRFRKMRAADCSSQESSIPQSQQSTPVSYQTSGFLHSIKSCEIAEQSNSMNRSSMTFSNSLQSSIHNMYYQEENLTQTFFRPENQPLKIDFPEQFSETEFSHLICDMGDIDRDNFVKMFKRVKEKDNSLIVSLSDKENKKDLKKSKIVITPIDYNPEQCREKSVKTSRIFKKQPSSHHKKKPSNYENQLRLETHSKFFVQNEDRNGGETERYHRRIDDYPGQNFLTRRYHYEENHRTDESSQSRSINKYKKRHIVEKAAALLHRVRSDDNMYRDYDIRKSRAKNYYPYY